MITQELLHHYFNYDPISGWFTNKFGRGPVREGARAGATSGHGYRRLTVDSMRIYEHHAAWLYVHGEHPEELDYIDGNGLHNAIVNLRPCSRTQNCCNAKRETGESGLKGAYLDHRNLQWYSKIQFGGQVKFLGNYDSAIEAHKAFIAAAELHHGEFALHKRPQPFIRRI